MKKISLVSKGFKVLSIIECIFNITLWYCACFLVDDIIKVAIIFITSVVIFCLFILYISFSSRVIISKDKLIIVQIKKIELNIKDIIEIYANGHFLCIVTSNNFYKFTGCNTLLGYEYSVKETKRIVKEIKGIIDNNKHLL